MSPSPPARLRVAAALIAVLTACCGLPAGDMAKSPGLSLRPPEGGAGNGKGKESGSGTDLGPDAIAVPSIDREKEVLKGITTLEDPSPAPPGSLGITTKEAKDGFAAGSIEWSVGDDKFGREGPGPAVMLGATAGANALPTDRLAMVATQCKDAMTACYEAALEASSETSGVVHLRLSIAADGALIEARVASSDVDSPTLEACLVEAVKGIRVPSDPGGAPFVVVLPIALSAGASDRGP